MIDFPFKLFYGVVEDINDPQKTGRVRVRCYGFHTDNKTLLKTVDLPWATVMLPTTSASSSGIGSSHGLVKGSHVVGFFRDGEDCQDPIVMFTYAGVPVKEAQPERGFNDPEGAFPRYIDESDVNRLARNEKIEDTIVSEKRENVEENVKSANGKSWNEPDVPYGAEYPYNKVYETTSGHVIEFDDTPGSERINLHHKSGSFVELYPDGSIVNKTKGSNYTVIDKDDNLFIKGDCNITVEGDASIKCEDANVECKKSFVKAAEEYLVETKLFKVVASVKALFETPLVEGTSEIKDSKRTMSGDRTIYNQHTHGVVDHNTAVPTSNQQ